MLESFHRLPIHSGDRSSGWMVTIAELNLNSKAELSPQIFYKSNSPKTHASTERNRDPKRGNYPLSINTRNWTFYWLKNKQEFSLF
jgi:hypothetical protein